MRNAEELKNVLADASDSKSPTHAIHQLAQQKLEAGDAVAALTTLLVLEQES